MTIKFAYPKRLRKKRELVRYIQGGQYKDMGSSTRQYDKHWFQQMSGHLDWLLVTLVLGGCSVCQNPCIYKPLRLLEPGAGSVVFASKAILRIFPQNAQEYRKSSFSLWPLISILSSLCSWMRYFLRVRWGCKRHSFFVTMFSRCLSPQCQFFSSP